MYSMWYESKFFFIMQRCVMVWSCRVFFPGWLLTVTLAFAFGWLNFTLKMLRCNTRYVHTVALLHRRCSHPQRHAIHQSVPLLVCVRRSNDFQLHMHYSSLPTTLINLLSYDLFSTHKEESRRFGYASTITVVYSDSDIFPLEFVCFTLSKVKTVA